MPESQTELSAPTTFLVAPKTASPRRRPPPPSLVVRFHEFAEGFVPDHCLADAEASRRARLVTRFGFLGLIFGAAYALFYLLIGHYWGVGIIVVCSLAFALAPFMMRRTGSLSLAGNWLSGIMAAGFTALCLVEGGVEGHAIAWLVSVPLCALLMVGKDAARIWTVVSFLAALSVMAAELAGIPLPRTYDPAWHPLVAAAGYLGLIVFMFVLGMVFELGRERAFNRMQEALNKLEISNDKLLQLNKEKTEFLGMAAHDLKNPLSAIICNADVIEKYPNHELISRMAGQITLAGIRMRDLISDLLDAHAIEEGRFATKLERCDLASLAALSIESNQVNATRKEIRIEMAAVGEQWAKTDRTAALQILDNLISNATKYSPIKSTVQVVISRERGLVTVTVKDLGPGISAEDQARLFQKFERLSARPTGGESSNGLGLAIAKRLAEAMSGTVNCSSVKGQGSAFSVSLPEWKD